MAQTESDVAGAESCGSTPSNRWIIEQQMMWARSQTNNGLSEARFPACRRQQHTHVKNTNPDRHYKGTENTGPTPQISEYLPFQVFQMPLIP